MEGLPSRVVLAVFAGYGLVILSLLIFTAAIISLLARRPALKLFAGALLSLSTAGAMFAPLMAGHTRWTIAATALGFLIAGAAQYIAASRNPSTYAASLTCALAAAAFGAAPSGVMFSWLRHSLAILPCLILAAASMKIAFQDSKSMTPLSRNRLLVYLCLADCFVFILALLYGITDGGVLYEGVWSDLMTNTRWRWVFSVFAGSILTSAAVYLIWPALQSLQPRTIFAVLALAVIMVAAGVGTSKIGEPSVRSQVTDNDVSEVKCRAIFPCFIQCTYNKGRHTGESVDDVYFWYALGLMRVVHVVSAN